MPTQLINREPLISIITVCFNEAERIAETLTSIVNQTYKNTELIIMDGGSTDGTIEVIEKFRPAAKAIFSGNDGGIYKAMNKALKISSGQYCIFMNGGDSFHSFQSIESIFYKWNSDHTFIYANLMVIFEDGTQKKSVNPAKLKNSFLANFGISQQCIFYKLDYLKAAGGFSERYEILSDYHMMLKIIAGDNESYKHFDVTVCNFYRGGVSNSKERSKQRCREHIEIISEFFPLRNRILSTLRFKIILITPKIISDHVKFFLNPYFEKLLRPKDY